MEHRDQMLMQQKQVEQDKRVEERKKLVEQAEERSRTIEQQEKESVMKGKAIAASKAMIDKENKSSNRGDAGGDIFTEDDIVCVPSTRPSTAVQDSLKKEIINHSQV